MAMVLDTTRNCSKLVSCLKQHGYTTVIRYYCRADITWKRLMPQEALTLGQAGISIAPVYQNRQDRAADFSRAKGETAGRDAYDYAMNSIFQPAGSGIYFAVDFDASSSEINGNVLPFFVGVAKAFKDMSDDGNPAYRVGVYGSGRTCRMIKEKGQADYTWLAQSVGWGEYIKFLNTKRWNLKQNMPARVCGIDCDPDEVNAALPDFGAFLLDADAMGAAAPVLERVTADNEYRVTASGGLRVRGGPSIEFETLSVVVFGAKVRVLSRHGDWAQIDATGDGGADGFVHASFLAPS